MNSTPTREEKSHDTMPQGHLLGGFHPVDRAHFNPICGEVDQHELGTMIGWIAGASNASQNLPT